MARRKKRKSKFKLILSLLIIIVLASSFGLYSYYQTSISALDKEDRALEEVEIPAGSNPATIGKILYEKGFIRDPKFFRLQVKLSKTGNLLKAGDYKFSRDMSIDDIIEALIRGGKSGETVRFTIPEGYELYMIGEKLENEGLVSKEVFMDLARDKANFWDDFPFLREVNDGLGLEGYLFPSTYEVYTSAREEDIIKKMLEGFEKVYEDQLKADMDRGDYSLKEIVTMASLIEREARNDDERALIASVYYNRLAINMKLQCDATVLYALGSRSDRVLLKDLEIDSPYNTYKHYGLPIGPISSVGLPSLRAALYPDTSDYLFYVAKPDLSGHVFTKTYAEHEKYAKEYQDSLK